MEGINVLWSKWHQQILLSRMLLMRDIMANKLLRFCSISAIILTVICQVNSSSTEEHCRRPNRFQEARLSEYHGTWYFLREDNFNKLDFNSRCVRGQFAVKPGGWSGIVSWILLQKDNNLYHNDLYEVWESAPGVIEYHSLTNTSISVTCYSLKFVPKDRAVVSCCFRINGVYLDQFEGYYKYGGTSVDEKIMENDYKEVGIKIKNTEKVSQDNADCFKQVTLV